MLYKVSRFSLIHNVLRVLMNHVLWRLPVFLKYGIGGAIRRGNLPYNLLNTGDTVVQIGAPWDLLKAGRSRAIHFARIVGPKGLVVVIEPDPKNIEELNNFKDKYNFENIIIVPSGAWDKNTRLRFLINDKHPASNLVEEAHNETKFSLDKYRAVEIDVSSLDNILTEYNIPSVDLLSITTNGSEKQILDGVESYINNVTYISIIGDPNEFPRIYDYNFKLKGEDDRGLLFEKNNS
jgi:FkbM family methyltransferase